MVPWSDTFSTPVKADYQEFHTQTKIFSICHQCISICYGLYLILGKKCTFAIRDKYFNNLVGLYFGMSKCHFPFAHIHVRLAYLFLEEDFRIFFDLIR